MGRQLCTASTESVFYVYVFTAIMTLGYMDYYNYRILISMAPLSNEIRSISSCIPQHLGPAIPEVGELDELQTFVGSKKTKSGSGRR